MGGIVPEGAQWLLIDGSAAYFFVGIFPNEDAITRMVDVILLEQNDE